MDWLLKQWEWIKDNEALVGWIAGLSILTLIVSAIAVPMVIRSLPRDYFLENSEQTEAIRRQHPVLRWLFLILKNLIGVILLLGGIIMLITPGQGVLTIFIGLMMLNFPGKRGFEIWLVRLKPINRAINWIRRRADQEPLELPPKLHRESKKADSRPIS